MNAFLAVQLTKLPINNVQDLVSKSYDLFMWEDGVMESYFRAFHPQDHLYGRVYEDARQNQRLGYISSTGEG